MTDYNKKVLCVAWAAAIGLAMFALAIVFGCGDGGSSNGNGGSHASVKRAPHFIGYSMPNGWQLNAPQPFASAMGDSGLTLTEIEWAPFIDAPRVCNGTTNATYPAQAGAFVSAMCAEGVSTFINIVNANGCAQTNEPDAYVTQALADITSLPHQECIILGGVSEPWASSASKMHHWTTLVRNSWHGQFILPANGGTVHPYWGDVSFNYLDSHPCSGIALDNLFDSRNPALVANTDCGPMLNPGPTVASLWTRKSLDSGVPLLVYDFRARVPDYATITAIGAEIQK